MTISPEQVFKKVGTHGQIVVGQAYAYNGEIVFTLEGLTAFANAVLAEYLGEPVGYVHENYSGLIARNGKAPMKPKPHEHSIALYAPRKE